MRNNCRKQLKQVLIVFQNKHSLLEQAFGFHSNPFWYNSKASRVSPGPLFHHQSRIKDEVTFKFPLHSCTNCVLISAFISVLISTFISTFIRKCNLQQPEKDTGNNVQRSKYSSIRIWPEESSQPSPRPERSSWHCRHGVIN